MNALVPIPAYNMQPVSFDEAERLARWMADVEVLPALKGKPALAMMVIEQALHWKMSPYAVALEVSVIQGKLMYSGKVVAAAIQTSGALVGRLFYDFTGTGDDRTITVSAMMRGESKIRTIELRVRDAKTSNGMWVKQPDQQLVYAGSRVWARRHLPEIMMGTYSPEEFDTIEGYAEPILMPGAAAAPAAAPVPDTTRAPPKPVDHVGMMRGRILACPDRDCILALGAKWNATFSKAASAGRPIALAVNSEVLDMLADALAAYDPPVVDIPADDEEMVA